MCSASITRLVHRKVPSEAKAAIAPVMITAVPGRSAAHRRTNNNGHLALTSDGSTILQNGPQVISLGAFFCTETQKTTVANHGCGGRRSPNPIPVIVVAFHQLQMSDEAKTQTFFVITDMRSLASATI
jgi:hypothetical protein